MTCDHASIVWVIQPPYKIHHLGFLPRFVLCNDPRPAAEQIADRYVGGWDSFKGMSFNIATKQLSYPGDPDLVPFAHAILHHTPETVFLYPFSWVLVYNDETRDFDVARVG